MPNSIRIEGWKGNRLYDLKITHEKNVQKVEFRLYTANVSKTIQESIISYGKLNAPFIEYSLQQTEKGSQLNIEVGSHKYSVICSDSEFTLFNAIDKIQLMKTDKISYFSEVKRLDDTGLFGLNASFVGNNGTKNILNYTHRTNVSNENILNIQYNKTDKEWLM